MSVTGDNRIATHADELDKKLIKEKWMYPQNPRTGRAQARQVKIKTVLRVANENPSLGYRVIANRMKNIGWEISYQTVRNILLGHGIDPAKQRASRLNWDQFFKTNWTGLFSWDFTAIKKWIEVNWKHIICYSL